MQWHTTLHNHAIFKDPEVGVAAKCETQGSLVALHGSEVFLAVGKSVRYADTARSQEYVVMDIPEVDFDIHSLTLNRSRSILVIAGSNTVVTTFLPRGSTLLLKKLRSNVLGASNHANTAIKQIRFHPHCSSDSSLVVLTQDSYLRLYELNLSFEDATTTVDLLTSDMRRLISHPYLGDSAEVESASFCFGAKGDGWNLFSVFVLATNGDLYVVCPLLPSNCHVEITDLEHFEVHAATEVNAPSAIAFARLLRAIDSGTRTFSGIAFGRPARLTGPVVQGPALFEPAPLEFTNFDTGCCSIGFLAAQPINVLAIATTEKIDICLLADPIIPKFGRDFLVSVRESISLPGIDHSVIQIFESFDTFFLSHKHGVHEVNMKQWLEELREAFETEDHTHIVETTVNCIPSQVTLQLDCRGSNVIGCDVVQDDLEQALLVIRDSYHAHLLPVFETSILTSLDGLDLGLDLDLDLDLENEKNVPAQSARYQSLLSSPSYKPQSISRVAEMVVPSSITNQKLKSDVESLQFLGRYATQLRKSMESIMSAFISMHRRFALQQKEHERQQIKLAALASTTAALDETTTARLKEVQERQTSLEGRCAKLVQTLMHSHSPRLSDAEKRFFDELKRVERHVLGPRGLTARMQSASVQLEDIKMAISKSVQGSKELAGNQLDSPLRAVHVNKFKTQIDCNEEILKKTKARLERLARLNKLSVSAE